MSDTRSSSIRLGTDCRLTLVFTRLDETLMLVSLDLTVRGQSIGTGFETHPAALPGFIAGLASMHRDLAGTATLSDYSNHAIVTFEVSDRRFGTVSVAGDFFREAHGPDARERLGVAVRFRLATDQSALPEFIDSLSRPNEPQSP